MDMLHSTFGQLDEAETELAAGPRARCDAPPIAVDLDGTLLLGDSLHEGLLSLLMRRPWLVFPLVLTLLAGKAAFKSYVAERTTLCREAPLHAELLGYLTEQKRLGRRIGLFSAADQRIVDAVAARVGLFTIAKGSNGGRNLSGADKLVAIREAYGDRFVYAGDAHVDLPIWRESEAVILVGRTTALRARLGPATTIERAFEGPRASPAVWLRALRVHQWAKNALVFVPAILALPVLKPVQSVQFLLAFAVLSLLASATYLVNDLADLSADRAHRSKRNRPLASGAIPLSHAVAAIGLIGAAAAGLASLLPVAILPPLFLYLATTLAYSFHIKRVPVLDVLCLGLLFTLRIQAGTTLNPGPAPYWLFAFSMFFFTSLALVKRYTELRASAAADAVPGRGYIAGDLAFVLAAGMASGMASLIVFLIYLGDQHFNRDLFQQPQWLGGAGIVLAYWLMRVWLLATRDQMHDDPVLFAVRDRASLAMAGVIGIALLLAW
jgi:4-hydroxybenzoate polyprenyltransferase